MTREQAIEAASEKAYEEDRDQVVGCDPVFGWVYRDNEDEGGISSLTQTFRVNSSGPVE